MGGGGRRRGTLGDREHWPQCALTSLIPGVSKEGCAPELTASKLLQDEVAKVQGGVPGRPSRRAGAVFQSLGFRCRRPSRGGQAHGTTPDLTPRSLRALTSSCPLMTAPKEWRERPPHGREGTHTLWHEGESRQHPGEMGLGERERPGDPFPPEPLGNIPAKCLTGSKHWGKWLLFSDLSTSHPTGHPED